MKPGVEIAVIGRGLTSCVAAACLAELGHTVAFAGMSEAETLETASAEAGLASFMASQRQRGTLNASHSVDSAVAECGVVVISADSQLAGSEVPALARQVMPLLQNGALLVLHAAAPVGTTDAVMALVDQMRPGAGITVVCAPPTAAGPASAREFQDAKRFVIGATDRFAARKLAGIMRRLSLEDVPVVYTTPRGAELICQATQTLVAMHAAFAQEMSLMCALANVDPNDVARAIDLDPSTGLHLVQPIESCLVADLAVRHRAMMTAQEMLRRPDAEGRSAPSLEDMPAISA